MSTLSFPFLRATQTKRTAAGPATAPQLSDAPLPANLTAERVLEAQHYTDRLFRFRTTRPAAFRFRAGEFVMIGLRSAERPLLRAYSVASPPWDDALEFYSIIAPNGPLTSRLKDIQPGDEILVGRKPTGTLVLDALTPAKRLFLFATGTGFAPFASVLREPDTYAKFDKIIALEPDLVLAFSDLQADLASELIRRGLNVVTFNQRSVAEILQMIRMLGGLIGCQPAAEALAERLEAGLGTIRARAAQLPRRPTAFFEEWDTPLISGIRWVEELVEIAGAEPIFPELRACGLAKDRIVDPADVARRNPEIVFASWCGKKVNAGTIRQRPGWDAVTAVRHGHIFEIKSTCILQPGPASLTDGLAQLHAHVSAVARSG